MPRFSPLCRQHADERRLAGALRLGGFSDPALVPRLKQADHSYDRRALADLLQVWAEADQRLAPLQTRDLLGVAVALDLPNAMAAWMAAGETLHADTLLACLLLHNEKPPQAGVWQYLAHSLTQGPCAAWAGVMMTHAILAGWDQQAKDLLARGVDAACAIPLRNTDAHDWLWTVDAKEQNMSDATTPFHLALREGRWGLAEDMRQGGVPIALEDGRGVRPLQEINDFLQQREYLNARLSQPPRDDEGIKEAVAWRERLISQERSLDLEAALGTVDEVSEGSGRRRL